jgi:hypothetical protein
MSFYAVDMRFFTGSGSGCGELVSHFPGQYKTGNETDTLKHKIDGNPGSG